MEISLHSFWRSSCSCRVRIVLALKNLEYIILPIHQFPQENLDPEYLAKNPMGQVPFLVYNDFSLSQSMSMMLYLEDKHPEPALILPNPEEKAGMTRIEWAQQVINEGFK
jgi:glutathione S-transferase